jgi:beta-ketoacyl synthase-like protein
MTSLCAYIDGLGLLGPGLRDWPHAAEVLSGAVAYSRQPTLIPTPEMLPGAERRRAGRVVKLALAAGFEATARAHVDAATLPSVFASSGGDGPNCHELCEVLAGEERAVSPTRFHNSVHNAASGYWSIAAGSTSPSSALCAFDGSFAAGLLESLTQIALYPDPLLLVVYDAQYPEPLYAKRPIPDAFALALVLTPHCGQHSLARISAALTDAPAQGLLEPQLEALRASIPAARSLPLLQLIARRETACVTVDYLDCARLRIETSIC